MSLETNNTSELAPPIEVVSQSADRSNTASSPAKQGQSTTVTKNDSLVSAQDLGHRVGNFHNYYSFYPPSDRLSQLNDILGYIANKSSSSDGASFTYTDLGCNEGDLTIEIAASLKERIVSSKVNFQGMDIDAELIERANNKWSNQSKDGGGLMEGSFVQGNIVTDLDMKVENQRDLISLFSTTMWVHIHAGDAGLEKVLRTMARKSSRFLLIEPQPSKCYRNAVQRLKKMGRPPISVQGLEWRGRLQEEMNRVLQQEKSFYPVLTTERTSWNRKLVLYEKRLTAEESESISKQKSKSTNKRRKVAEGDEGQASGGCDAY